MNKVALKHIDHIARQLPVVKYQAVESSIIKGVNLSDAQREEIYMKGIDVLPHGDYQKSFVVARNVDHKQRMKKIYKKRGKIGLITYLKPFIKPESLGKVQVQIMRIIP